MLCADTKSNVEIFSPELGENKLFPISRNQDNTIRYSADGSIEYHDHLLEFAVDVRPSTSISTGGNVDFDKLCGVPEETNLRVDEVYVYFFNPLVSYNFDTDNYTDFDD